MEPWATFHGIDGIFSKFITGASHRELCCFEPQTTVGVPTVSFLDKDIRRLESLKGDGKSLTPFDGGDFVSLVLRTVTPYLFEKRSIILQRAGILVVKSSF